MEAFPIYDFPQSPLALEADLLAFSGTLESSFTGRSFLGTFDSESGLTLPTNSGGGGLSPVQFTPFFSLQSTDYQYADLEFTSPGNPFSQDILCAQDRRGSFHGDATIIPIEPQAPASYHPVPWSVEGDETSMKIEGQHYERSSLNEESAAYCPGRIQPSLTAPTSQLVPTGPPTGDNDLKPSALKREWSSMEAEKKSTMPKHMRQRNPLIRSHVEISRKGNSVKKRNASCDIPAGHSTKNIDELISQSTDEQEVKELKQQKRLLRNRQAAFALSSYRHDQHPFMASRFHARLMAVQKS